MTVKDIVRAHLEAIGADGLAGEDCGCGLDDLFPCPRECSVSACVPAKKQKCSRDCPKYDNCESDAYGFECYREMEVVNVPSVQIAPFVDPVGKTYVGESH